MSDASSWTPCDAALSARYREYRASALQAANPYSPVSARLTGNLVLFLWCAHIMLSPFYVFNSGLPQPCDFTIIGILVVMILWCGLSISRTLVPFVVVLVLFTGYVTIINAAWGVLLSDAQFLTSALFYWFNFFVYLLTFSEYRRLGKRFLYWTCATILVSIFILVCLSINSPGKVYRFDKPSAILFFNNANQLAYYSLLTGSIFLLCARSIRLPRIMSFLEPALYSAIVYLNMFAVARTGTICAVILLLLGACTRSIKSALVYAVLILPIAATGIGWGHTGTLLERTARKEQSFAQELSHRGYDRIVNHPEYLLFGAGEGPRRQEGRIRSECPGELHSTLGIVLFSYGLIGIVLLLSLFWLILKRCGVRSLIYLLPVVVFGLTTNGLRHTELWILVAVLVCLRYPEAAPGRTQETYLE